MARPTKLIRRFERITVRYSVTEKRLVEGFAQRHGITPAEFVRRKSLDQQLKETLTEEELTLYRQLVGLSNNLNQLTRYSHAKRQLIVDKISVTLERVNQILDKLI